MTQFSVTEFQDIYERVSAEMKNVIFHMVNECWLPSSTPPPKQSKPKTAPFRRKLLCFLSTATSVKRTANKEQKNRQYSCQKHGLPVVFMHLARLSLYNLCFKVQKGKNIHEEYNSLKLSIY